MRFKFCGDADCPDWVLSEINTLSKLSSIKVKQLTQIVSRGIIQPPINNEKAEKCLADSKLDSGNDLKACVSCLNFILSSSTRYSCDSNALQTELQQLGLPREHSVSIKKVYEEQSSQLMETFKSQSLKVNRLQDFSLKVNEDLRCVSLDLDIDGKEENVILSPYTVDVLLENLKQVRETMVELRNASV